VDCRTYLARAPLMEEEAEATAPDADLRALERAEEAEEPAEAAAEEAEEAA